MDDLVTTDQIESHLMREVAAAGGAKKWCRKNKVSMDHALHMVANGSAATLPTVLSALGFRKVVRYERVAVTSGQREVKS